MFWLILRIVLAVYLVVGFLVYLRSENRSEQKGAALRMIKTILLWPGFLGRGRKG
nr:hypothetical protein [uncultured Solibaculum sp.]